MSVCTLERAKSIGIHRRFKSVHSNWVCFKATPMGTYAQNEEEEKKKTAHTHTQNKVAIRLCAGRGGNIHLKLNSIIKTHSV